MLRRTFTWLAVLGGGGKGGVVWGEGRGGGGVGGEGLRKGHI